MTTMTGAWPLTRFGLRRDRVLITGATLLLVGLCYASASALSSIYPTVADRVAAAQTLDASPAIVALYGPILDVHSRGELAMTKATVLYTVFLAALVAVVVRRSTRADEESGRGELLGGTSVGRNAALTAAVVEGALVSLLVGVLAAVVDVAAGLPVIGSLAFGASWMGTGVLAAGLTAAVCQLSASARTCGGAAVGVLGVLYLLRAVGDVSLPWLGWLSGFGWSTRLQAWSSGPRWWVLGLYAAAAAVVVGLAGVLRTRRDLGAGLLDARPGPPAGSPRLADALTLALRLQRATLLTWTVATAGGGLLLGAVVPTVGRIFDSSSAREILARLGGAGALQETLVAAELSVLAVAVTCFAIAIVSRGGGEEADGRTEQVLATATSRARAWTATLVVALGGVTWLLAVGGVAIALGYGAGFGRVVGAALGQAPAVLLVSAVAVAAYSLRASLSAAGWGVLVLFVAIGQVGEALRLPPWLVGVSPYAHVPRMPVEPFELIPAVTMATLAVLVLVCGWVAFRRRDIG